MTHPPFELFRPPFDMNHICWTPARAESTSMDTKAITEQRRRLAGDASGQSAGGNTATTRTTNPPTQDAITIATHTVSATAMPLRACSARDHVHVGSTTDADRNAPNDQEPGHERCTRLRNHSRAPPSAVPGRLIHSKPATPVVLALLTPAGDHRSSYVVGGIATTEASR